ncbi:MAG TPA: YicC/YloC family endoribonuclease [Gemmatimonadaceae bacterium]|nr:YicC/YloC family endoribonuclease [Gemmatimonadaceae bacterium]
MTGFGTAEGMVGLARVTVEVRTVNHRFFNSSIKLPSAFAAWEGEVREALRRRISRGHVSLSARVERVEDSPIQVDEARFAAYVAQLRDLGQRHGLSAELDLATVLKLPGVIVTAATEEIGGSAAELVAIVEAAASALSAMRSEEGGRLAQSISERLDVIESALGRIAQRSPARLAEQKARLERSVAELAGGVAVDPQRLAQEIAIIADRLDVSEELDRFASHLKSFRDTLRDGGKEPVGKRLGFVLQEMLRETNTTGSKANDAPMLAEVVSIKEELERIREQVENLE